MLPTGNRLLEEALGHCDPIYRVAILRDLNVSQMQESQVEPVLNWIAFCRLREAYSQEPVDSLIPQMTALLQNELANSERALGLAKADLRLGFSCEGDGNVRGGHFTPATIQAKIDGLYQALAELYDRLPEFQIHES